MSTNTRNANGLFVVLAIVLVLIACSLIAATVGKSVVAPAKAESNVAAWDSVVPDYTSYGPEAQQPDAHCMGSALVASDAFVWYCVVPPVVYEDSPEWDCATMGNLICGPVHTNTPAPKAKAKDNEAPATVVTVAPSPAVETVAPAPVATEPPAVVEPEPVKEKANCGVGNGVDADTKGCPDGANDGEGTGPGNPGRKGGK